MGQPKPFDLPYFLLASLARGLGNAADPSASQVLPTHHANSAWLVLETSKVIRGRTQIQRHVFDPDLILTTVDGMKTDADGSSSAKRLHIGNAFIPWSLILIIR